MTDVNSPEGLISNFQTQLEHQWRRFRDIEGDDSARGSSYEAALQQLLEEYFGGRFDILSNCSIMDSQLACFNSFRNNAQNEIDVVALFSHASPRIILRETNLNWVPLEGVSFLCEVKSRIDKPRLESDLEKLEIVRDLEMDPDERFGTKVHGEYSVDHQLHCLVYDRCSISNNSLNSLLKENSVWDMVLLVEDDILIVNNTLPVIEYLHAMAVSSQTQNVEKEFDEPMEIVTPGEEDSYCLSLGNGLAWFIIALSITIPVPLGVTTVSSLSQLVSRSSTEVKLGATSSIDEMNSVEYKPANFEDTDEN